MVSGLGLYSASPTLGKPGGDTRRISLHVDTSRQVNAFFFFKSKIRRKKVKTTFSSIEMLSKCRSPCVSLNLCLLEINLEEGLTSVEM